MSKKKEEKKRRKKKKTKNVHNFFKIKTKQNKTKKMLLLLDVLL
tara:strand:+ start:941 stop:1072 length:132 start_codon:yes stop_codon:yes gene_type:complete